MAERLFVSKDLQIVMEKMWEAREKWYYIGLCFEIPSSQLDVIKKDSKDTDEMFTSMIKEWLGRGHSCTWSTAYDVLKNPIVDKGSVAEKLGEWLRDKGRKRKATAQYGGPSKKSKIDESMISVSKGPDCPITMWGNTATHNDCVYFSRGDVIFEFDLTSRNWTKFIKCPQVYNGFATIQNELVVVGGLLPSEDESQVATNKVICFPLEKNKGKRKSTRHKKEEKKEWKEKYPVMKQERAIPEVLVFGNYLIVLGGYIIHDTEKKPIISVEVLNTESKCWYSNDRISLPEEFSSMHWLSACICGEDLYIAAKHDDPGFEDYIRNEARREIEDDIDYQEGDEVNMDCDIDYDGPWPCYSMYRCRVNTLLHIAQESNDNTTCKIEETILWQRLQHPHDSVYINPALKTDVYSNLMEISRNEEHESGYLSYSVCCFTLSSMNNELFAVGCQHIYSICDKYLRVLLEDAYDAYKSKLECLRMAAPPNWSLTSRNDEETIDCECHIYHYDVDDDSWDLVKSTPHNGKSSKNPSVAVVDNKLVIVRHSETMHIVTFP